MQKLQNLYSNDPKNRSSFPADDAIFKILYLAIKNASQKWTIPTKMIFPDYFLLNYWFKEQSSR
ncbi:MAG: hypothetical protein FWB86_02735 [Treponema sp.]|nr:hypothetical protein [Treponema sp.]MCL2251781.1 hypothetical protein [Treponema sp.]